MNHLKAPLLNLLFILQFVLSSSLIGQLPEQDCINAIPVCTSIYLQEISYEGEGSGWNEINHDISCLSSGERNGVWYSFQVQESGNLGFELVPVDLSDDYDWALFNLTDHVCDDIFQNEELALSCNYSALLGMTGATGSNTQTSGNSGSDNENALIPVNIGDELVLYVSNFSSTNSGYQLSFEISEVNIVAENSDPDFSSISITPNAELEILAGTDNIYISFDTNINCDSISTNIVQLFGETSTHSGNIIVDDCVTNSIGSFGDKFLVEIAPPLTEPGSYSLQMVSLTGSNVLISFCGTFSGKTGSDTLAINFEVVSLEDLHKSFQEDITSCSDLSSGNIGVDLLDENYASYFNYTWNDGATGSSRSNLEQGIYTLTVQSAATSVEYEFELLNPESTMELSSIETEPICGNNDGSIVIEASMGIEPYSYFINGTEQSSNLFDGLGEGTYSISVKDGDGCESIIVSELVCKNNTGLADPVNKMVSFFPNPASNKLFVKYRNSDKAVAIKLYSSEGKLVYQNDSFDNTFIDLSSFSDGLYFIQLMNDEQVWTETIYKGN